MTKKTVADHMHAVFILACENGVANETCDMLAYEIIKTTANTLSTMEKRRLVDFIDHRMRDIAMKPLKKL